MHENTQRIAVFQLLNIAFLFPTYQSALYTRDHAIQPPVATALLPPYLLPAPAAPPHSSGALP